MKDKYPKLYRIVVDHLHSWNASFLPLGYGGLNDYYMALTFAVIRISVEAPDISVSDAFELAKEATSEYFDNRKTSVLQEETA